MFYCKLRAKQSARRPKRKLDDCDCLHSFQNGGLLDLLISSDEPVEGLALLQQCREVNRNRFSRNQVMGYLVMTVKKQSIPITVSHCTLLKVQQA